MTAVFGAVVWHLRELIPAPIRTASVTLALGLAIGAVFGIFIGRTGYVLATALVSLAIYWELPSRWRLTALLVPLALAVLVSLVAPQAQQRALLVKTEVTALMRGASPDAGETSSGVRMNFWKNSLLAIQKQPWIGHGAGSWSSQYDALQPASALPGYVPTAGNPHQEYLLWGVELGLPGLALLLGIFIAVWRLSNSFEQQARRAAQSVLAATMMACLFNCALLDALIGDFLCMSLALVLNFGLHPAARHPPGSSLPSLPGPCDTPAQAVISSRGAGRPPLQRGIHLPRGRIRHPRAGAPAIVTSPPRVAGEPRRGLGSG
jgi:O-antigen ligase